MNKFKESISVDLAEQRAYEEHKRKRYAKEIHKKCGNTRKRLEEER